MREDMDVYYYETAAGHDLGRDPLKAIIAPRPIGWISTLSAERVPNLAPYSFFNQFSDAPAIIGFASIDRKDSLRNVEATGEFVFNLATRDLADAMNRTSQHFSPDVDEFEQAGLAKAACRLVRPPRVEASPAALECKVSQIIRLRDRNGRDIDRWLTLGEVVGVHIQKRFLAEGRFQTARARPIMRAGYAGDYWEIDATGHFEMRRPRT